MNRSQLIGKTIIKKNNLQLHQFNENSLDFLYLFRNYHSVHIMPTSIHFYFKFSEYIVTEVQEHCVRIDCLSEQKFSPQQEKV